MGRQWWQDLKWNGLFWINLVLFGSYGAAWLVQGLWPVSGIDRHTLAGMIAFSLLVLGWIVQASFQARTVDQDAPEPPEG